MVRPYHIYPYGIINSLPYNNKPISYTPVASIYLCIFNDAKSYEVYNSFGLEKAFKAAIKRTTIKRSFERRKMELKDTRTIFVISIATRIF